MSAKTSAQPGRRTPLSLNAGPKQPQLSKSFTGPSASNSGAKNDNKTTKDQKTESTVAAAAAPAAELKDSNQKDTKKQPNTDKKQQQNVADKNEEKKTQNGVGKGNAKEKQQQQPQQQQQQQGNNKNGNANNQAKEKKDKTDKTEKVEKNDKPVKVVEKPVKVVEKPDSKEQQKVNEVVEIKEKKEDEKKPAEKKVTEKVKRTDAESSVEKKKSSDKAENMDISVEAGTENAATPKKPVLEKKTATPTKQQIAVEKVTPSKSTTKAITPVKATVILPNEDVEMESLTIEPSPVKAKPVAVFVEPIIATITPTATSTPGKTLKNKKSEVVALAVGGCSPLPDRTACPRKFSQIAGRRSIRPIGNEYTPTQFNSNAQFRESYRRINTELDVTSTTNTSLNVTVGSEVPNNSSLSMFFGRALGGRKRERTPPNTSLSTIDLQVEYSPPKRARLDVQGFFSAVVSSPLSLLRSRFSKTSIHSSSTPMKLRSKLAAAVVEDEEEVCEDVQNVSGISIEEEIPNGTDEESNAVDDNTVGNEANEAELPMEDSDSPIKTNGVGELDTPAEGDDAEQLNTEKCGLEKASSSAGVDAEDTVDIKITDTPIGGADVPLTKNKRCSIM